MNQVSWTSILIGLALFLFGIDYLSLSLQELSPTRLKNLLAKCTSSTFKAILIGCFITCIIQSSFCHNCFNSEFNQCKPLDIFAKYWHYYGSQYWHNHNSDYCRF